jgi:hypothetical protein
MTGRPDRSEAAEYYFTYIDKVPGDDILAVLQAQLPETLSVLEGISEDRSRHRYAEGKWSIREMVGHVNDCERLFAFRAFWFARGFDSPLPSFDQDAAVPLAGSEARTLHDHIEEFRLLRGATLALFKTMPAEAWTRHGIASDRPFTVRSLAFIAAGHVAHHLAILRERYL